MDIEHALKQIVSRVKETGVGVSFTYDEINEWLGISSGEDLMLAYDRLSANLTKEYAIALELEEDCIATIPSERRK